ncbi:DUF3604 domain-containing protein [Salinisphaera sp. PC39]|uniref:DUF3604 domain-containing protein n=1 Tax=Salinisphaera sp. PC39 TaxID=1304156 RepID=UPI00334003EC
MRKVSLGVVLLGLACAGLALVIALDRRGTPQQAGTVTDAARSTETVAARAARQRAAGAPATKQILFGDVHAHTTFSMDAFAWSLPMLGGEGTHPPADACDYARYVAGLDFWALTDHAESLTPRHWRMIKDTVRACNAAAGDPANPDLVTFLGWEWTQMGNTRASHYGHRNVFLLHTGEDRVPARPIAADGVAFRAMRNDPLNAFQKYIGPYLVDFDNRQRQVDLQHKQADLRSWPVCEQGRPVRELPADCLEVAATPADLFDKLADWGFPAMVVPHGTTWGFYTPPGYDWAKQVTPAQHDPESQRLIEVFSGHGNAEEYREWRAVEFDGQGNPVCPEPTADYLPSCHRAGEIIRSRCDDPASDDCERRVHEAEQNYLAAGRAGHLTVPGVTPDDWLDAGQCRDCYLPPLNHRPGGSVQYILAKRNFEATDEDGDPFGYRFGFIGSSDNHNARPGNGFKERDRAVVTDTYGARSGIAQDQFVDAAKPDPDQRWSQPHELGASRYSFLQVNESERQASFFYSGGLMAVHSAGRDREAIWEAIRRREVYATSGDRMLLWFDLRNAPGGPRPMGGEATMTDAPRFRVRAVGAFEQKPGCPEDVVRTIGAERLAKLSGGECYHPSDRRRPIERIEVVRIRPQIAAGEPVAELIDDPWRVHDCPADGGGCAFTFSDPGFTAGGRETLYYVRALQAPTPTINADGLRCEYDDSGRCVAVDVCYGDPRTDADDDCTAPARERAWSSPIYVHHGG